MKILQKLFGEINLSWPKLFIFAVITGVYTGLICQVPFLKYSSFHNIAVSFECWILFGVLIIVNSKSNLDSALKCFVFFLISQPLVYLVEVPFVGWSIMGYYRNWILWTLLTFPMGFIGYYMKKDKWWGIMIIAPMLLFLGYHYSGFLHQMMFSFPLQLLSCVFCIACMFAFVLLIFKNKKIKIAGVIINCAIIAVMTVMALRVPPVYSTDIIFSGEETDVFDDSYSVYMTDEKYGDVSIKYDDVIETYLVHAEFRRSGKTQVILRSPDGETTVYDVIIKPDTYEVTEQ